MSTPEPDRFIGYGRQTIQQEDIEAVTQALTSDYLTQGPSVAAFEQALADYVGTKYAVAVCNGTAALHIACLAAGLGPGDVGVTQAITFVASANCMAYCGARPDLVDIDPENLNMSAPSLAAYLEEVPEAKVIIPVSMGGLSANGEALRKVAGNRIIIEDASHSCGGYYEGSTEKVGTATSYANMTTFSFHPVKPFTTGEGGAVVTNDETLYRKLIAARSHGIVRDVDQLEDKAQATNPWYYEQQSLGYNYRLTDLQCALGLAQISRLDDFISRRRELALYFDERFAEAPHINPRQGSAKQRAANGHHLYIADIDYKAIGKSRADVMNALRALKIGTQVHYIPVYEQPYYRARFHNATAQFPAANAYYETCLSLPCFPTLTDEEAAYVADSILQIINGKT